MAVNVVTVEDDMPLSIVLSTFNKYEFRRFPVLNSRQEAVGIVTAHSHSHSHLHTPGQSH